MTDALRRAFEAAGRLPEQDQNELAAAILEELAADKHWEAALAGSQDALERLADEALREAFTPRCAPRDVCWGRARPGAAPRG